MKHSNNFIYHPGGENENLPGNDPKIANTAASTDPATAHPEHKTVIEEIKEALQEWSNKDQQDQEFDDTRV